jgi:BNR/Asp-box repeat protein
MRIVVGTSGGAFLADGSRQAEGIGAQMTRQIAICDGALLVAAADGVYRSTDHGQSWKRAGVDAGEVWTVGVSPHAEGVVYAGTQPAHLFVSHDAGVSWNEVPSFLETPGADRWCIPNSSAGARALALAFDPFDASRLWAGVEVGGVIASQDGGAHWTGTWVGPNADVHLLMPHPARRDALFATTGYGRNDSRAMEPAMAGPYRSDDGGTTWQYLGDGMSVHYTRPMCIDPRAPHALTVPGVPDVRSSIADPGGAQAMLYRSEDDGLTWRSLGDAAHSPSAARFTAVACDPELAGGVLVGTETGEIWRVSADAAWTRVCDGLQAVQAVLPLP